MTSARGGPAYRSSIAAGLAWLLLVGSTAHEGGRVERTKSAQLVRENTIAVAVTNPALGSTHPNSVIPKCKDLTGADVDCTVLATSAALAQARDSDWQAWAALAGAIIGGLTLIAAFLAAKWAKAAAGHTATAAKAATETLDHSKDVTDRQLRAYLFPVDATVKLSKGVQSSLIHVSVPMVNSGQTPAKLTFYSILAKYKSPKTVQSIIDHTVSEWRGTVKQTTNVEQLIGPNGKTVIPLYTSMPSAHFDHSEGRMGYTLEQPSTIIKVELEWWYQDYAGRTWRETAVFTSANIKWDTLAKQSLDMPQTEAKSSNRVSAPNDDGLTARS